MQALGELSKLEDSCWSVGVTTVTAECKKILPALRYAMRCWEDL